MFGMRIRILPVLGLAALTVTAIAQKSPDQANSTRSDEAWRNLQDLRQKVEEKAPSGVNSVEFHAGREKALYDAAAAFVKDFPNEPQEPQALI
jgi:hypothetical protein